MIMLFFPHSAFCRKKTWKYGDPTPYVKPKLVDILVKASVTVENESYSYFYTVCNSSKNLPNVGLTYFWIDTRNDLNTHPLSYSDLTREHDYFEHTQILEDAPRIHLFDKKYPVGWYFEESSQKPLRGLWGCEDCVYSGNKIFPGDNLSGFGFLTKEPIGIRQYIVSAYDVNEDVWFNGLDADTLEYFVTSEDWGTESNKGIEYLGKTIAPVAPPEPFTISSWVARMETDVLEARKQEWIKEDKQLKTIQKFLRDLLPRPDSEDKQNFGFAKAKGPSPDAARMDAPLIYVGEKEKTRLKKTVVAIERYVEKEKKAGNLTDEADALLRLNALYLIKKIKEGDYKKKEKD